MLDASFLRPTDRESPPLRDRLFTFRDYLDKEGCTILAWRIEDFWRARGYLMIRAWAEATKTMGRFDRSRPFYQIKSNIGGNGYPPGND